MEQCDPIGARLDRLPLSRFHFRIFGIISFSLLITGFLQLFWQRGAGKVSQQRLVK